MTSVQQLVEKGLRRQGQDLAAQVHHAPGLRQREALDVQHHQFAAFETVTQCMARQYRQPHAAGDQFADRLIARQR